MMGSHMHSQPRMLIRFTTAAFAILFEFLSLAAFAEYRLAPGDVLEVSVSGIPELRQRATVKLDGDVSFPLIGAVAVEGLLLSEAQERVKEKMAKKAFRQRTTEGRENMVVIWSDEIAVDIVEYNPIYLNGDVSKPGELKFRPGMTIRQAIALAGGYEFTRLRATNPFLISADLRSEYEVLWTEFAKEQAILSRLRAELSGNPDLDSREVVKPPITPDLASKIRERELEQMKVRDTDYHNEKKYLQRAMEQLNGQVSTLLEQQQRGEEATKADSFDLETVRDLYMKGTVPITRMQEARRALLMTSTTFLQSVAQLTQVKREREELGRKLERVDDLRRLELLRDIQSSEVKIATIRSRLQAVSEKLLYTGTLRSQLGFGNEGKPDIVVFRRGPHGQERQAADPDTQLLPGDTVEVSLRDDKLGQASAQQLGDR